MRAETTVQRLLAPFLHGGRQPELLEVPIEVSEIGDRGEVLARRHSSLVVNNSTCRARVAFHLRFLRFLCLRDQVVHVNIDGRLEETGIATIVIFDRRMTRVVVNHARQLLVAGVIDVEFNWIR